VNNKLIPEIPHADTLLMALSSAEVIWAALFQRPTLDKPYMAFLDHHSGKIMAQKAAYSSLCMLLSSPCPMSPLVGMVLLII
jgi:hypothetical protein